MFMLSFLQIPKGVRKRLDFIIHGFFFCKMMNTKRNIGSPSGILFVDLEIKVV
jgi:hypothetical protein